MKLLKNAKRVVRVQSKTIIAMFLLVTMVFSSLPLEVIAQQLGDFHAISDTITTVTVGGEEMIIGADGSFQIPETTVTVTYHDFFDEVGIGHVITQSLPRGEPDYISINPINIYFQGEEHVLSENDTIMVDLYDDGIIVEHPVSRYRWLDGERIRIDDPRIGNLVPVIPHEDSEIVRFAEGILPLSAFPPIQGEIAYIWQTYQPAANVGMGAPWNITVQARRYTIIINAVEYELFCADPMRPGPENNTINAARWGAFGQLTEARWINSFKIWFSK